MSTRSTNLAQNYSISKLKRLGRELYQSKKYEDALQLFNAALQQTIDFDTLDHRAATFVRLNKLDLALKDGREMCRLDKSNAKAYHRTGRVLELMDKNDVALQIYERGLRQVGPDQVCHVLSVLASPNALLNAGLAPKSHTRQVTPRRVTSKSD